MRKLASFQKLLNQIYLICLFCIAGVSLSGFIQSSKIIHKRQLAVWRIECELGIINDPDCPIDGGWTSWEPWSPCHGFCDEVGQRRRTRQCINPPPSKDGMPCSGPEEEVESCYLNNCTSEDFKKLIQGDPIRLQAFRQLEVVPALMERCLRTDCSIEAIEGALSSDNSWKLDPEAVWNALNCVKHNIGCHVLGEWGSWGSWSGCSALCGRGRRWRVRKCDTPPPSNAQLICSGTPLQAEECVGDQCALNEVDNENPNVRIWSPWSNWSACSEQCGSGIRRRGRVCHETTISDQVGTWETHCVGEHEELEVCEAKECKLDGGWSGWSTWGPCSQTCGAGRRHRTRSCTRPVPNGGGKKCVGPKTEFGTCFLSPCEAFTHVIVVLNGDSHLQYNFANKRSTMFHFYVRFLPLSPHGTLVRRGTIHNPLVRLSLQKWHICLDASGTSSTCTVPRICSQTVLDPAVWHSALITVSSKAATLRLDDAALPIQASFSCDPELPNERMNILIGERLHGYLQDMSLNFIPLHMFVPRKKKLVNEDFLPTSTADLAFEKANIDEASLFLNDGQYIRVPCYDNHDEWRLELTLKPKRESGTILFLKDDSYESWLHLELQSARLKLKVTSGDFRSETISTTECPPEQWLNIVLFKTRERNAIEASINSGEKLHIVLEEEIIKSKRDINALTVIAEKINDHNVHQNKQTMQQTQPPIKICSDEFFVGGFPLDIIIREESFPFLGIISSISINNNMLDLYTLNVERYKDNGIQVSSRTASVSGSYHEISWGNSNRLNLTCLYARSSEYPHGAQWLYLDSAITEALSGKTLRAIDDGRILKLDASADNDLRGFYTCRAHNKRGTRNVVSYGVVGKLKDAFYYPTKAGTIALFTTIVLVAASFTWLIIECYYDLRTGYGFFRDAHLTPEQEAEAICKYIDDNVALIGPAAAKMAKIRARLKAHKQAMASRSSFAAQEPQGLLQIENPVIDEDSSLVELRSLPALPEEIIKSSKSSPHAMNHKVFRCDPCYINSISPRQGSSNSPITKHTTSTSLEASSPRFLCNRLLMARKINHSKENVWSKTNRIAYNRNFDLSKPPKADLQTIQSMSNTTNVKISPAKLVLQKFQRLQSDS